MSGPTSAYALPMGRRPGRMLRDGAPNGKVRGMSAQTTIGHAPEDVLGALAARAAYSRRFLGKVSD